MKARPITVRIPDELVTRLDDSSNSRAAYITAILRDALDRGVMVTTAGTLVEPPNGDLFASKTTTRKPTTTRAKR